ncbi:MAG: hypothetical protein E7043_00625 [Lentisphaerae bacterium]|nr:hypothetical protein [Lentisphaerota bacterium]
MIKKLLSKKLLLFFLIYAALMLLFIGFGTTVAALPHTARMEKNFCKSASHLVSQGTHPRLLWAVSDNYTDALILNVALGYRYSGHTPLAAAMQNTLHHTRPGKNPVQELSAFTASPGESENFSYGNYNRYFFGSAPIAKLAHYIGSLKSLQTALGSIVCILAFVLFAWLYKKYGWEKAAAWLFILMTTQFYICFHSLQFTPVFIIGMGILATALCMPDDLRLKYALFFSGGMLCAYFDLLTTPLLSVMIPALFLAEADFRKSDGCWNNWLKIFAGYPLFWFTGYVASWGSKLIIADICNGKLFSCIHNISYRMSSDGGFEHTADASRLTAISRAFKEFTSLNTFIFAVICITAAIILITYLYQKRSVDKAVAVGYLAYAIVPLMYMLVMANHSIVHPWMSYRNISLVLTSLFLLVTSSKKKSDGVNK